MIKRMIVNFAYFLNTSTSYQKRKRFFYNLLENSEYKYKKHFDLFMIILIFMSVAILIHDVKAELNDELRFFNNYLISIIFLIEYLLRLWISSSASKIIIQQYEYDSMLDNKFRFSKALRKILSTKLKYIFSFKAIIDLLAIVPFFHELRLLRIFILFRVFKLFRYAKSIQTFSSVITAKKFEFFTLFIFASIIIFVSSVLIYVMEANNPTSPINTLFDAFYWSIVTISTVGFGDITPVTQAGQVVAIFVIIAGIGVLAFTTSLIVTAFTEKLDEIKNVKLIDNISKMKEFYLICGYENLSKEVAIQLLKHNKVIIIEEDPIKAELARMDGFVSVNYNPGSIDSYKKLRINIKTQVKAILCLSHSDVENVYTALTVRSMSKEVFILSTLKNNGNKNKLNFAGVNEIIYEKELVGMVAKEFVAQAVAFEAIHALRSSYNNIKIDEILITERVVLNYLMVSELNNKKYRIVLLGIHKNSKKRFFFNPIDSTVLEVGDYLLVVGNTQFIKDFRLSLQKKGSK